MYNFGKFLKMVVFFRFDLSFWTKINIPIITLYDALKCSGIKFISNNKKLGKLYFENVNKYKIVTDYSVGTIVQIFCYKNYNLEYLDKEKDYIVFDLGMNKGFSSMWFAMNERVKKVIGYEINPNLLPYIKENSRMNKELFDKIVTHNYGLLDKDTNVDLYILNNDDGITTTDFDFFNIYWSKRRKKGVIEKNVKVKNATKEIIKYFDKYPSNNYILKIDVEGAEYQILPNLYKNNILNKFDIIYIEVHKGLDSLEKYFNGFKITELNKHSDDLITFVALKL